MGKVNARGGRRAYTSATFAGGEETKIKELRRARENKIRAAKEKIQAETKRLIAKLREQRRTEKREVDERKKKEQAKGNQLAVALTTALSARAKGEE